MSRSALAVTTACSVDAAGAELGQPAERQGDEDPPTLTVAPCPVVHGTGYRVYPPHSFTGFIVEAGDVPACDSDTVFLHVGPVQAAS